MDSIIPVWTLSANGEKEDTLNPLVRLASSGFHSHQKKNQLMNFIHSYFQTLNSQTLNQSTPQQLSKFKSLWINKIYIHSIWMNLKNIMLIKSIEYKKAQTPFMCGSWQKTYLMYCKRNHSTCRREKVHVWAGVVMTDTTWEMFQVTEMSLLGEGLQNASIWQCLATFTLKMQYCYISCTQWSWILKAVFLFHHSYPTQEELK